MSKTKLHNSANNISARNNYTASFEGSDGRVYRVNGKTHASALTALKRVYKLAEGTEVTIRCNVNSMPPITVII